MKLKFRAWDIKYKIMRNWDWLLNKQCTFFNSKYFIPLQYICLKDKNKKEIYNGDIIENQFGERFLVKWDNKRAMWDINRDEDFYLRFYPDWKIIGNKFENLELKKIK